MQDFDSQIVLENTAKESKSLVDEIKRMLKWHQSSTEHEEFGVKPGGPPPKPKYYLVTDSV